VYTKNDRDSAERVCACRLSACASRHGTEDDEAAWCDKRRCCSCNLRLYTHTRTFANNESYCMQQRIAGMQRT